MNTKYLYLTAIILSMSVFSCSDIFEKDLTKDKVTILAPVNNHKTDIATQTFWWEEVKGATHFNLQVVTPSFSSIHRLALDTNVSDNQFAHTFPPGQYQWRVKALNSSSSTSYVTYSLTIDTTSELNNQIVVLQHPVNNSYSQNLNNNFSWLSIPNATFYNLQIVYNNFASGSTPVLDTIVNTNMVNYTFATDSVYQWKVRAFNASGSTAFSNPYNFTTDITPPDAPILSSPGHLDTITAQFNMSWNRGSTSGTPVTDSLYIYSDSLITLIKRLHKTTNSHSDSLGSGDYFWRVRSQDAAGNTGNYSVLRKFWIQ